MKTAVDDVSKVKGRVTGGVVVQSRKRKRQDEEEEGGGQGSSTGPDVKAVKLNPQSSDRAHQEKSELCNISQSLCGC